MIRHLIPRIEWGPWSGSAITAGTQDLVDDCDGGCVTLQWLGLIVEVAVGRVGAYARKPLMADRRPKGGPPANDGRCLTCIEHGAPYDGPCEFCGTPASPWPNGGRL